MTTLLSNMLLDIDNCLGLSDKTKGETCSGSARSAYEKLKQETNNELSTMQFYIDEIDSTFSSFVADVIDAMNKVDAYYDAVNDAIDTVGNTLCTKDADWCNFNRLAWQIFIPALPTFPRPKFVPSAVNIWGEGYNHAMNDAKVNLSLTFQTVYDTIDGIKASINSDLNDANFDAYQPPSYEGGNISKIVDSHVASSNAYIHSLNTNNTNHEPSSSSSDNKWTISDGKESSYSTNWMSGHVNLLQIEQIAIYVVSLFDNLYIFDYLYRCKHPLLDLSALTYVTI